jgi:hypothetical protein
MMILDGSECHSAVHYPLYLPTIFGAMKGGAILFKYVNILLTGDILPVLDGIAFPNRKHLLTHHLK